MWPFHGPSFHWAELVVIPGQEASRSSRLLSVLHVSAKASSPTDYIKPELVHFSFME